MASPMVSALKKLDQALDPSDTPKRLHPAGLCATPTQRPCRAKSREVHFTGLHFIPILLKPLPSHLGLNIVFFLPFF